MTEVRTTRAGMAFGALLAGALAVSPMGAAAQTEAAAGMAEATLGIGETAVFGEGLRVFLARVTPETGMARVAVNGLETREAALDRSVVEGDCKVTMTAVAEGEATFVGGCGAGAVAQATHGTGTPLAVGQTATFGDGLRVFMSKVDGEAEAARVAVNGLELVTLDVGRPVVVENCTVTLVGLDGVLALVEGRC